MLQHTIKPERRRLDALGAEIPVEEDAGRPAGSAPGAIVVRAQGVQGEGGRRPDRDVRCRL